MNIRSLTPEELQSILVGNRRVWAFPSQARLDWLLPLPPRQEVPCVLAESDAGRVIALLMKQSLFARRVEVCFFREEGCMIEPTIRFLCQEIADMCGVDHIQTRLPAGDYLHDTLLDAGFIETACLREHLRVSIDSYVDVKLYSNLLTRGESSGSRTQAISV